MGQLGLQPPCDSRPGLTVLAVPLFHALDTIIAHDPSIRTSGFFWLIQIPLILYLRARGVNSYTHTRFDSHPMPRAAQLVFFYPAASLSWWRPPMVTTTHTHPPDQALPGPAVCLVRRGRQSLTY